MPPRDDLLLAAPIEAVADWDTVGALGIPTFTLQLQRLDEFQFADLKLSPIVRSGLHAVAVDEERADRTPTLWDDDPRITQSAPWGSLRRGGGNGIAGNESGLSDRSLRWMIDRLAPLGVVFAHPLAWVPQPDARGAAHQPWVDPPWNLRPRGPRHFPAGLFVGQSLVDRLAAGPVPFAPSLPAAVYSPGNLSDYILGSSLLAGVRVA